MFIAVTLKEKRLKNIFSKRYILKEITHRGTTFFELELKNSSCINHKKVRQLIGNSPIILSNSIAKPNGKPLNFVDDSLYSLKLFENGLKQLLQKGEIEKNYKMPVLIDIKSRYQSIADMLLRYFKTIEIVTARKDLYIHYVNAKLYECGAAVIIRENVDKLVKSAIYISPSGILFDKINQKGVKILSVNPIFGAESDVTHSFRATTPNELKNIMPMNISEHLYQAALYNHCQKRELAELYPTSMSESSQLVNTMLV